MEILSLSAIFWIALFGSIGHCSGMCGGFIVAFTTSRVDVELSYKQKVLYHISYHLFRVLAYIFVGVIAFLFFKTIGVSKEIKLVMLVVIALIMFAIGYSMLGKSKFLYTLESLNPFDQIIRAKIKKLFQKTNLINTAFFGFLNGLLPCGFVYFFALSAASSESLIEAVSIMLIFGLATMPILLSIAGASSFLQKYKYKEVAQRVAAWIILVYGYLMLFKAYKLYIS